MSERLTRRRNHRHGEVVTTARANIVWHIGLSLLFAMLVLHPALGAWPFRVFRYLLVIACAAYFVGSIVQRQKIVIAARASRRRPR